MTIQVSKYSFWAHRHQKTKLGNIVIEIACSDLAKDQSYVTSGKPRIFQQWADVCKWPNQHGYTNQHGYHLTTTFDPKRKDLNNEIGPVNIEEVDEMMGADKVKIYNVRAIHVAALMGKLDLVHWLLTQDRVRAQDGVDALIWSQSECGRESAGTALHLAARAGHLEVVHELLRAGAILRLHVSLALLWNGQRIQKSRVP